MMQAVVANDLASVCLSFGQAVQRQLDGSTSFLGWRHTCGDIVLDGEAEVVVSFAMYIYITFSTFMQAAVHLSDSVDI